MLAKDIARILLDIRAVSLSPQKPYRYTSGILSPIYCDNRLIISYPQARDTIITAFLQVIESQALAFDVVAGTATAGIPHAAFIADRLQKPMVYVRASSKAHGKQNQIEGKIESGQRVLVIEDLVSTGKSALEACEALRNAGAVVTDCLAIFTYQFKDTDQQFQQHTLKLHTLTHFHALIELALMQQLITEKEYHLVKQWNHDPQAWEALFNSVQP